MRTIPTAARRAMYAQETRAAFPILIELSNPDYPEIVRAVNNSVDLFYNGHTYKAFPFQFDPPDETVDGIANARLIIDNIDRSIVAFVRSVQSRIHVKAVAMYYNDQEVPDFQALVAWEFELANVVYDAFTVSGELIYEDRLSIRVPALEMTPQDFPGVH